MNELELDTLIARVASVADADVASWADEQPLKDFAEKIMLTTPIEFDPGPETALIVNSDSEHCGSGLRRWYRVAALAAVAIVIVGLGAAAYYQRSGSQKVTASDGRLITSDVILADGVVTEAEYQAGARAVLSCLAEVGIEQKVEFDNPNGHASFTGGDSSGLTDEQARQERVRCFDEHLSGNVGLGWASALGQINLDDLRRQTITTFECVEHRIGLDFGEVTYDRFGYLTPEGRRTKDTAFEHEDQRSWVGCQNELGYLADVQAETKALVDCVEARTGIDFGEVTYDSGFLTEAGQQAVRAASTHQSDVPWVACQDELGLQ